MIAIVTQHQLQQKITYILFLAFHTDSVVVLAMQCDFEGFQILCQGENVLVNGGTGYKQLFTQLIDAAAVKGTQLHPDKNFTCLWGIIGKRFIFLPYTFQYVQLVPDFTINTDTDAGTIAPIVTAFCISIGQTGNLIAPFLLEGILVAIVWPFAIWLLKKSYHTGKEGIQEIFSSGKLNWITTMTSTLGGITLGALAASYVTLSSPLEFVLGKGSKIALQADVLDVILKNILPLSMVLLSVYLLNKKVSAVKIILILAAVCALGVLIGIF